MVYTHQLSLSFLSICSSIITVRTCPHYTVQMPRGKVTCGHFSVFLLDAFHFLKTPSWVSMSSSSPGSPLNAFAGCFSGITFTLMSVFPGEVADGGQNNQTTRASSWSCVQRRTPQTWGLRDLETPFITVVTHCSDICCLHRKSQRRNDSKVTHRMR